MRWYEYKMEVDDLAAPDDLKAKLLAMTDTLTAEEKAEPMMAAPAPADRCTRSTPEHRSQEEKAHPLPGKAAGHAGCLSGRVRAGLQHPASGHRDGQRKKQRAHPVRSRRLCPTAPLPLWQRAGLISSMPRWTAPPRR